MNSAMYFYNQTSSLRWRALFFLNPFLSLPWWLHFQYPCWWELGLPGLNLVGGTHANRLGACLFVSLPVIGSGCAPLCGSQWVMEVGEDERSFITAPKFGGVQPASDFPWLPPGDLLFLHLLLAWANLDLPCGSHLRLLLHHYEDTDLSVASPGLRFPSPGARGRRCHHRGEWFTKSSMW